MARYGRTAAATAPRERLAWRGGTLPLAWQTRVDPADVICYADIDGEPIPKGRPRMTRARFNEVTGELRQGHVYTPAETRHAEENLGWVLKAARLRPEPVPHPCGILLFFRTRHGRCDVDNLTKMCLDAANNILWTDDQQVAEIHAHVLRHCTDPGTNLLVWTTNRRAPGV